MNAAINGRSRIFSALALGALLAGCGSTVQLGPGPASGVGGGLGVGTPGADTGSASSTAAIGEQTSSAANGITPSTGSNDGSVNTEQAGTGSLGGSVASATAGKIPKIFKIGVQTSDNTSTALVALGGKAGTADPEQLYRILVNYINSHGGIARRPFELAKVNIDATSSPATQSQVSCASWTQDQHVTMAIPGSAVQDNNVMRACMGKAQTPTLYGSIYSTVPRAGFAASPLWFEATGMDLEAFARTYVAGLAAQGFFKNTKVGVVYYDKGEFTRVYHDVMVPALKQAGAVDPVGYAASISGASDLSNGSAQMSAAVLNFRSKGVNRVLFFEPWVGYFTFMQNARSQGYQPVYGLSSQSAPYTMQDQNLITPQELSGARLVSWIPISDVKDQTPYLGPRAALCERIYKDGGVKLASDALTRGAELNACELLLLVQDAYRNAPDKLSPQDFGDGLAALGDRVQLATNQFASFGPSKHWAASMYRPGRYDSAKQAFVYDGPPRPVVQ